MKRITLGQISVLVFIIAAFILGILLSRMSTTPSTVNLAPSTNTPRSITMVAMIASLVPTDTGPTPLATLTPSKTLLPPPTFEPPTLTVAPSATQAISPSPTLDLSINIPGLIGLESPTPTGGPAACVVRKDWKLTYTIQRNDALANIATVYNTTVDALVKGNCLSNGNVIVIGQVIKVPGSVQPSTPVVKCFPYEELTPIQLTQNVPGGGIVTFDWRGPIAPHNLLRILRSDGSKAYESVVDLRENDQVDVGANLPNAGTYTWYVYPLDQNYQQVCPEGGPWTFSKAQAPTATPKSAGGFATP